MAIFYLNLKLKQKGMPDKKYILSAEEALQKLHRMSLEIAENLSGNDAPILLIGVRNSGMVIAEKLGVLLKSYLKNELKIVAVSLDKELPTEVILSEQVTLDGINIVITDDVTNSGRTLLYALKPLLNSYPKSIQTLVLVERMHKLFPVKPDYIGLSVSTTQSQHIQVEVLNGEVMGAYVI
jgi:pyrimidine operon attenuation protein / uracil phosphoribosyltransferase